MRVSANEEMRQQIETEEISKKIRRGLSSGNGCEQPPETSEGQCMLIQMSGGRWSMGKPQEAWR